MLTCPVCHKPMYTPQPPLYWSSTTTNTAPWFNQFTITASATTSMPTPIEYCFGNCWYTHTFPLTNIVPKIELTPEPLQLDKVLEEVDEILRKARGEE